jgi:hypothetical protein
MQKSMTLLLALCLSLATAYAQPSFFGGVGAGYYTSVILGQQNYGQRDQASDYRYAASYGLQLGIDFNNQHIIQLDPTILNIGANYKPSPATANLDKDIRISYIHLPLSYRFVINGGNNGLNKGTRFFVGVGPYVNLLSSVDYQTAVNGNDVSLYEYLTAIPAGGGFNRNITALNQLIPDRKNPDFNEMFTSLDLGAMLMLGGQSFLTENLKLSYEIRAGISLSDINAEDWRLPNFDGNYDGSRNLFGGLNLGLTYYF